MVSLSGGSSGDHSSTGPLKILQAASPQRLSSRCEPPHTGAWRVARVLRRSLDACCGVYLDRHRVDFFWGTATDGSKFL